MPRGRIYLHYLGVHPEYGDGVAVCPTRFPSPVAVAAGLFTDSYVVFYPAGIEGTGAKAVTALRKVL